MTLTVKEAGLALADPKAYADDRRFHESLALLRRESPVHLVEAPDYNPFWAITRHEDVLEIERNHQIFLNAPRPLLATKELDRLNREQAEQGDRAAHAHPHGRPRPPRHPGDHAPTGSCPRAIGQLERPRQGAGRAGRRPDGGPRAASATSPRDIAMPFPLQVILAHPRPARERLRRACCKLTQELFGGDRRRAAARHQTPRTNARRSCIDFFAYFQRPDRGRGAPTRPTTSRRSSPTPRSTASRSSDWRRSRTTSSSPPPATTPPRRRWPAACTPSSRTPTSWQRLRDRPVPDADRRRRDHPLGDAGQALHAHRRRGLRAARPSRSAPGDVGAAVVPVGQPRRGRVRRPVPLRRRPRTRTSTWRSGSASTTASAPCSPAWRSARSSTELLPRLRSIELAGAPENIADPVRRRPQAPADPLLPGLRKTRCRSLPRCCAPPTPPTRSSRSTSPTPAPARSSCGSRAPGCATPTCSDASPATWSPSRSSSATRAPAWSRRSAPASPGSPRATTWSCRSTRAGRARTAAPGSPAPAPR